MKIWQKKAPEKDVMDEYWDKKALESLAPSAPLGVFMTYYFKGKDKEDALKRLLQLFKKRGVTVTKVVKVRVLSPATRKGSLISYAIDFYGISGKKMKS